MKQNVLYNKKYSCIQNMYFRETLLGQLTVFMKQIRDDFISRTGGGAGDKKPPKGKNLPEVVNNMVWVRQLEAKVEEKSSTAEALLGDLAGFKSFRRDAMDLLEELQNWRRDQFDDWSREMVSQIEDPDHPLR